MKIEQVSMTIRELLELHKNSMLTANPEYQRGSVWNLPQKKRLIDSVLREYPLPLIYLQHVKREVGGYKRDDFEIIDGQQRINAFHEFHEGAFTLFDPLKQAFKARFPAFIRDEPCPWASKDFPSLAPHLKRRFLDRPIPVAKIVSTDENEARDLFVRLQAGMPLNAQEKRDAWPGNFTDFILRTGGKPEITKYPGHEFFRDLMGASKTNRGKFRQLAAQMFMLFTAHRDPHGPRFCDINAPSIDDFYYENLGFDPMSEGPRRFITILEKLHFCFRGKKTKKFLGHEALHLVLLVDTLLDNYTNTWRDNLAQAFEKFRAALAEAKLTRNDPQPDQFWLRYGALTRVNSDRGENIRHRHVFFSQHMLDYLSAVPKDPQRTFGPIEREVVYYRYDRKCQVCQAEVPWAEVDIHHVDPHADGGPTDLDNAALVHKKCHPKGNAAKKFARDFKAARRKS